MECITKQAKAKISIPAFAKAIVEGVYDLRIILNSKEPKIILTPAIHTSIPPM